MNPSVFVYLEFLRKTLLPLPGVTEKMCFGTPAFYVKKKIFTRIKEDGENLVLGTLERDKWMQANPETYYITDHYRNYDYMLVRLDKVDPEELKELLITAWRNRATGKLISEYENNL
ncbi:MmcQ/YjbR family DNA-binding protein [Mucilaginibacter aquariorum]|uniref:MmcQ/YjbR family DNA-binding protein n=1 Tax=Mucilaginibacter aquariorum TaxID=2967225 RepID=A0ABT1T0X1_9SPHI|nr:MmcQ/YjbR family DNA-binding protein [Mucilaginibacter aquariorum]MCQ6958260.1 MmcQ/YjbR family DNA-binding protein [Mucilaginibacter aquariorum]